jgi:hypothetical protein
MESAVPPRFVTVTNALWIPGRILFSLSIVALGFETIVCARVGGHSLGSGPPVIPCIPWLPAIPLIAGIFGSIWAICGIGLLARRGLLAARTLGSLLVLSALVMILPKYLMASGNILLRSALFQALALAAIALLQPGRDPAPEWLERTGRFLLGLALVTFGLDHFLALQDTSALLPQWIPLHEIWVEICGVALVVGPTLGACSTWRDVCFLGGDAAPAKSSRTQHRPGCDAGS